MLAPQRRLRVVIEALELGDELTGADQIDVVLERLLDVFVQLGRCFLELGVRLLELIDLVGVDLPDNMPPSERLAGSLAGDVTTLQR